MKSIVQIIIAILLIPSISRGDDNACSSYVLAEASSGMILESQDAETPRPPASMVKLMLAYSVLKQIEEGNLKPTDMVNASTAASKIGGSQVYLKEGESFTVQDLMQAVMVQSANDAAYALAEHIGGTASGFVDIMNEDAKKLGLMYSEFHSPHGLPPGDNQKPDLASAKDFLALSRGLLIEHPEILEQTKIKEIPFRGGEFIMRNHNKLLFKDPSVDGLKTGFYNKAGFNITLTAERYGTRLVAVLMGCEKRKERDQLGQELLERGFRKYTIKNYSIEDLSKNLNTIVTNGSPNSIALHVKEPIKLSILKEKANSLKIENEICSGLIAPLEENVSCGMVKIIDGTTVLATRELYTSSAVKKAGLVERAKNWWAGN